MAGASLKSRKALRECFGAGLSQFVVVGHEKLVPSS